MGKLGSKLLTSLALQVTWLVARIEMHAEGLVEDPATKADFDKHNASR